MADNKVSFVLGGIGFPYVSNYDIIEENMATSYAPLFKKPLVIPSGRAGSSFTVSLDFPTVYEVNKYLTSLIAMFNSSPIVPFEFDPIRAKMGIPQDQTMLAGMKSLEISTVSGQVGYIVANLELIWCNYLPFAANSIYSETLYNSAVGQVLFATYKDNNLAPYVIDDGSLSLLHSSSGLDLNLPPTNPSLILKAIRVTMENTFASLPIVGYTHPILQVMGGALKGGSLVFESPGPDHTTLNELNRYLQSISAGMIKNRNAGKSHKQRKDLLQIGVQNVLLNTCGIHTILQDRSRLADVRNTLAGCEYVLNFYDIGSLEDYSGIKQKFLTNSNKVKQMLNTFNLIDKNEPLRNELLAKGDIKDYNLTDYYFNLTVGSSARDVSKDIQTLMELQGQVPEPGTVLNNYDSLDADEKAELDNIFTKYEGVSESVAYNELNFKKVKDEAKGTEDATVDDDHPAYTGLGIDDTVVDPYSIFNSKPKTDDGYLLNRYKKPTPSVVEDLKENIGKDLYDYIYKEKSKNEFSNMYPVVQLYFFEEDKEFTDGPDDNLDDYYMLDSIEEVMVIASKDYPAATMTATIINAWNDVKLNAEAEKAQKEASEDVSKAGTAQENKIPTKFLQAGTLVQLRKGQSNSSKSLEVIFNGRITDIDSQGVHMIITAQDAGLDLTRNIGTVPHVARVTMGPEKKGNTSSLVKLKTTDKDLQEIVDKIMKDSGIVGGEANLLALLYLYLTYSFDLLWPSETDWNTKAWLGSAGKEGDIDLPQLNIKQHIKDNLQLPAYVSILAGFEKPLDLLSIINNSNAWDMLNELVLLFPGYIVATRPAGLNETTIYVGSRDGFITTNSADNLKGTLKYYNRIANDNDLSLEFFLRHELLNAENQSTFNYSVDTFNENWFFSKEYKERQTEIKRYKSIKKQLDSLLKVVNKGDLDDYDPLTLTDTNWFWGLGDEKYNSTLADFFNKAMSKWKAELNRFSDNKEGYNTELLRRTHIADSDYNLMFNNIKENSDVFNAISVNWASGKNTAGVPYYDPDNIVTVSFPGVTKSGLKIEYYQPRNVFNKEMATRMGVSLLMKEFSRSYDGEFAMFSDRHIRPYDFVYMNDKSNGMHGPVEVRDSIFYAGKNTGVHYVIVPDLIVDYAVDDDWKLEQPYPFMPVLEVLKSRGLHTTDLTNMSYFTTSAVDGTKLEAVAAWTKKVLDWKNDSVQIYALPLSRSTEKGMEVMLKGVERFGSVGEASALSRIVSHLDKDEEKELVKQAEDIAETLVVETGLGGIAEDLVDLGGEGLDELAKLGFKARKFLGGP